MGKQQPNTTMNSQHTNPTAIAGKAHTDREWKIPDFQSLCERQNRTHGTMDAIIAIISLMENNKTICCLIKMALEEFSTQHGPFNFYSNSMPSCVSQ